MDFGGAKDRVNAQYNLDAGVYQESVTNNESAELQAAKLAASQASQTANGRVYYAHVEAMKSGISGQFDPNANCTNKLLVPLRDSNGNPCVVLIGSLPLTKEEWTITSEMIDPVDFKAETSQPNLSTLIQSVQQLTDRSVRSIYRSNGTLYVPSASQTTVHKECSVEITIGAGGKGIIDSKLCPLTIATPTVGGVTSSLDIYLPTSKTVLFGDDDFLSVHDKFIETTGVGDVILERKTEFANILRVLSDSTQIESGDEQLGDLYETIMGYVIDFQEQKKKEEQLAINAISNYGSILSSNLADTGSFLDRCATLIQNLPTNSGGQVQSLANALQDINDTHQANEGTIDSLFEDANGRHELTAAVGQTAARNYASQLQTDFDNVESNLDTVILTYKTNYTNAYDAYAYATETATSGTSVMGSGTGAWTAKAAATPVDTSAAKSGGQVAGASKVNVLAGTQIAGSVATLENAKIALSQNDATYSQSIEDEVKDRWDEATVGAATVQASSEQMMADLNALLDDLGVVLDPAVETH